ncbi:glutathione S-transferase C-terminal domain-containing protein [Pseudomonas panipatensis]|jgi:glutathione S-transferase|uniref:Glutathione S-transferase n=1 Tax=Pseudomonas panipatensis TaxID=428992 RepID=A0A1G8DY15_9PSED|nr:glutathione S-transferase C-terminal domain-containing protein [Pseudomonas panipatensis]SDH62612.1 Glutathione S-transferase [Pseudomonas panipatensis]SMP39155.1 Glutathione S-transferase [Pseudomonas panipatensis]
MITLFQFPPAFNVPNISPFCLKLETFLRLAGLEYHVQHVMDPRKGPKGKLPFIKVDGEVIADSEVIIQALQRRYALDLDAGLDARGRGWAVAITRLCDQHLAPLLVYFRWIDGPGWKQVAPVLLRGIPAPLRPLLGALVRRKIRGQLAGVGLMAHSRDELLEFAQRDLEALDGLLGDVPFFGGAQPCSADAAAYGILANLILSTLETPLNHMAREYERLVAYCERMQQRVWS